MREWKSKVEAIHPRRCRICRDDNIISVYHGETSRTLYSRLIEHTRSQENKQDDNPLFKHDETIHHGVKQKYSFEPQRFFLDRLTRQVHEGVRINRTLKDTTCRLMNSRSEFRQGVFPRVEIRRGLSD